jgi:hypothetical protein
MADNLEKDDLEKMVPHRTIRLEELVYNSVFGSSMGVAVGMCEQDPNLPALVGGCVVATSGLLGGLVATYARSRIDSGILGPLSTYENWVGLLLVGASVFYSWGISFMAFKYIGQ